MHFINKCINKCIIELIVSYHYSMLGAAVCDGGLLQARDRSNSTVDSREQSRLSGQTGRATRHGTV